jgi:hypothetical protein
VQHMHMHHVCITHDNYYMVINSIRLAHFRKINYHSCFYSL